MPIALKSARIFALTAETYPRTEDGSSRFALMTAAANARWTPHGWARTAFTRWRVTLGCGAGHRPRVDGSPLVRGAWNTSVGKCASRAAQSSTGVQVGLSFARSPDAWAARRSGVRAST